MGKISSALAVFVFAAQVLNSNDGYSQQYCYNLTPSPSCESFLGNRIPDFGCAGCNYAHECVDYENALRSIPLSNWNDPGKAMFVDATGKETYTSDIKVCAHRFSCETDCILSPTSGNYECQRTQTPPFQWWIHNDDIGGDDCPS